MQVEISKIIRQLSTERFEAYRLAGESDEQALARVCWNTALSEALYPCLQALEVSFRNSLHQAVAKVGGGPDWILLSGALQPNEREMLEKVKDDLAIRRKPLTPGYLIAELSFGFWTSLVDVRYDKLWPKIIKEVVPAMPNAIRTRSEISKRMNSVRLLRNAVSHHHSIWHWKDLEQRHATIHTLLDWIEPAFGSFVRRHDRFPAVLTAGYEAYL